MTGRGSNFLVRFFCKRRNFGAEREVRALVWKPLFGPDKNQFAWDAKTPDGLSVEVDLAGLISRIHLAPRSDPWIVEVVARVVRKYGLSDVQVVRSSLLDPPP